MPEVGALLVLASLLHGVALGAGLNSSLHHHFHIKG